MNEKRFDDRLTPAELEADYWREQAQQAIMDEEILEATEGDIVQLSELESLEEEIVELRDALVAAEAEIGVLTKKLISEVEYWQNEALEAEARLSAELDNEQAADEGYREEMLERDEQIVELRQAIDYWRDRANTED
jgi:hypothetical protein